MQEYLSIQSQIHESLLSVLDPRLSSGQHVGAGDRRVWQNAGRIPERNYQRLSHYQPIGWL